VRGLRLRGQWLWCKSSRMKSPVIELSSTKLRRLGLAPLLPLLLSLLSLSGLSCGGDPVTELPGAKGDLLAGRGPIRTSGVTGAERMTDGFVAVDGDFWRTDITAVIEPQGSAVWDLGEARDLSCLLLQGDNNDAYLIEGSDDGNVFRPLWTAGPTGRSGMQIRNVRDLSAARARYLRLTASGGDRFYSVGELAVYSSCPAASEWPPRLLARPGAPVSEAAHGRMIMLVLVSAAFLFINRRRAPDWVRLLVVAPLGLGLSVVMALRELWPVAPEEQSWVRAVVAVIVAVIFLRELLRPQNYPAHPRVTAAALVLMAVISAGCYYHFFVPQFRDESKGRLTMVHPWDMRVYFPIAKYFNELRFDGLYLASVAAYLDNHPGMSEEAVANVHLRDLNTNLLTTGRAAMPEIRAVRQRFSPERWESFKKDMRYFEDVMGSGGYLGSLTDHGGNATPVWLLGGYLLFGAAPASELVMSLTALIDPLLLALLFFVVARTYGTRVMLILMIVWGTSDFSLFTGTNLAGSTLRTDWLVALGLGACALKSGRNVLGGALLAYGGLIRAFPALAAMFLAVPPLWWIAGTWRKQRKLPTLAELRQAQRPALRAMAGAAITVVALVGLSSALFGFSGSWGTWSKKIAMHAEKPNSNHVGWRAMMMYSPSLEARKVADDRRLEPWTAWQESQRETLAKRKPVFYLGILGLVALAALAARGRRPDQAAMIGLTLVFALTYPANYYCLYVFLLPLMATEGGRPRPLSEPEGKTLLGWVTVVLLVLAFAQSLTLGDWPDVTYTYQAFLLCGAIIAILVPMARDAFGLPPFGGPRATAQDEKAKAKSERPSRA
jgi:hypothetical protein